MVLLMLLLLVVLVVVPAAAGREAAARTAAAAICGQPGHVTQLHCRWWCVNALIGDSEHRATSTSENYFNYPKV